jgi:hypothetical protein
VTTKAQAVEASRRYRERHPERALQATKDWQARNPEKVQANGRHWREVNGEAHRISELQRRQMGRDWAQTFKLEQGCMDCPDGTVWPAECLDFDHVTDDKFDNVSRMLSQGYKLERIQVEIAKCEVVCANHHRMRTASRLSAGGGDAL